MSRKGFSLAEVVVAVGLLGVIIVIIAGVFVHGLHAIKKGRYRIVAVNIADKKCSELRDLFLNNFTPLDMDTIRNSIYGTESVSADFDWGAATDPVHIEGKETVDNIEYNFIIDINEEGTVNDLKAVDVTISWKEVEGNRQLRISTYMSRPPVL